jgi:hypothetical protein
MEIWEHRRFGVSCFHKIWTLTLKISTDVLHRIATGSHIAATTPLSCAARSFVVLRHWVVPPLLSHAARQLHVIAHRWEKFLFGTANVLAGLSLPKLCPLYLAAESIRTCHKHSISSPN